MKRAIKQMLESSNAKRLQAKGAATLMLASAAGLALAQTAPDPNAAITSAVTTILAIVAAGGAGYITIKLALVGWTVGAKFISRLGGKA